jgi:hypothetical protein
VTKLDHIEASVHEILGGKRHTSRNSFLGGIQISLNQFLRVEEVHQYMDYFMKTMTGYHQKVNLFLHSGLILDNDSLSLILHYQWDY